MSFEVFLETAWSEHGHDPKLAAAKLSAAFDQLQTAQQAVALLQFAEHVLVGHLGQFAEANAFYKKFRTLEYPDILIVHQAVTCAETVLRLTQEDSAPVEVLSKSDQVRVYSISASLLAERKNIERAKSHFEKAASLAEMLPNSDPSVRVLAVQANNTAAKLEEWPSRGVVDVDFMIQTATVARKFWERAGTWQQISRAEYRLAKCWLAAGNPGLAMIHARRGMTLVERNGSSPMELFYLQEVFAKAHLLDEDFDSARRAVKLMKTHLEEIPAAQKPLCDPLFQELQKSISK